MRIESDQLQNKNTDLSGLDVKARLFISPQSASSPTRLTLGHSSSAIEPSQGPSNMLVHSCTLPGSQGSCTGCLIVHLVLSRLFWVSLCGMYCGPRHTQTHPPWAHPPSVFSGVGGFTQEES